MAGPAAKAKKDPSRSNFSPPRCNLHPQPQPNFSQLLREWFFAKELLQAVGGLGAGGVAVQGLIGLLDQLRHLIARCEEEIGQTAKAHPDFAIIDSFPGAGPVMAPRLLAALGAQRERFGSASDLQCYTGIAPVVARSGQQCWVHWRWACPKFVRQTVHEWAQHTMKKCGWARDYYQRQRENNKSHHAAIRALAYKWLRILYKCWQDRTPYEEARYLASQAHRAATRLMLEPDGLKIQWKSVAGFLKAEQNPA